jgi:hypothetical protein
VVVDVKVDELITAKDRLNALCGVDRPESILTSKRSPTVQALLTGLSCGASSSVAGILSGRQFLAAYCFCSRQRAGLEQMD